MKSAVAALLLVLQLLVPLMACPAEADAPGLSRVYVGTDGLAHIANHNGRLDRAISPEGGQAGVADPRLSADHRSAGWLVEERNWGASYPIALRLAVYRAGRERIITDGWMIYDWTFVDGGRRVAISTGVTHGATQRTLSLYDIHSGRRIAHWTGDLSAASPAWAKVLKR